MTENFDPSTVDPQTEDRLTEPVSIDDALEADRVVAEGPDSRNADGFGFDEDVARGGDDSAAAEQGNRDEDEMEADEEDPEVDEIVRTDIEDIDPAL